MRLQYVSKYISLSEEGLVSRLECPLDQGPLMQNLREDDIIFLYCLSCNYKKDIGISFYETIKKEVDKNV